MLCLYFSADIGFVNCMPTWIFITLNQSNFTSNSSTLNESCSHLKFLSKIFEDKIGLQILLHRSLKIHQNTPVQKNPLQIQENHSIFNILSIYNIIAWTQLSVSFLTKYTRGKKKENIEIKTNIINSNKTPPASKSINSETWK